MSTEFGMKLDRNFNLIIDTSKGSRLSNGWLSAEYADDVTGCRTLLNPTPVRLRLNLEVCGTEIVKSREGGPLDILFVVAWSPDLSWTYKELINLFNVDTINCPILTLKLIESVEDEERPLSLSHDRYIIWKG